MKPQRTLRHIARGTSGAYPFARLTSAFVTSQTIVRLYYLISLYLIAELFKKFITSWSLLNVADLPLLWPIKWAVRLEMQTAVYLIASIGIGGTIFAALFPEKRMFRLLAFIGLLFTVALENSFGKINHNMHGWLAVAFCFVMLPSIIKKRPLRIEKMRYLLIFWMAQAFLLWFYTMAGAWKLNFGIQQLFSGDVHAFHPYAMAHQIANRLLQDDSTSILGPFLLNFPLLGWPLYVSAIYLELFSIIAAFRPSLHRLWGISLALFHIGTYLTMTIAFNQNILLLGLLLIASPFHPPTWHWSDAVRDLPLIGKILQRFI